MIRYFMLAVILLIVGCSEDRRSTIVRTPASMQGEITATIAIDTCMFFPLPSSGTLDSLCGRSSLLTITFEYVYPDQISEQITDDLIIRTRHVKTSSTYWEFTNESVASALLPLFSDSAVSCSAYRVMGQNLDSRGMSVSAAWNRGSEVCTMRISGPLEIPVDSLGFPLIENDTDWSGTIYIEHYVGSTFEMARGQADITIKNLRNVPVDTTVIDSN